MKIFHVAPYGPNSCGIYEACRDMAKADVMSGHQVYFIDKGYIKDGKQEFYPIGTVDDRGGFQLTVGNPKDLDKADLIVAHSMPHMEWIARNQVPIVFIVHGRPLYSFKLEYMNEDLRSYTHMNDLAKWPRIKKMVYFWPEFTPYWCTFPQEKLAPLNYPVIDQVRFSPSGSTHDLKQNKGDFNILICDSWREDVDMFEIFNGAIQAAKQLKDVNVKFHLYGAETKNGQLKPCWKILTNEMYRLGKMGELCGRMTKMEETYRAMDAVLTPHKIITRVIGEALSCGVPVIASEGCDVAQFHCDPHDPYSISDAIKSFVNSNQEENKKKALLESRKLSIERYAQEINKIYRDVLKFK